MLRHAVPARSESYKAIGIGIIKLCLRNAHYRGQAPAMGSYFSSGSLWVCSALLASCFQTSVI
jgi:hypothetical protein